MTLWVHSVLAYYSVRTLYIVHDIAHRAYNVQRYGASTSYCTESQGHKVIRSNAHGMFPEMDGSAGLNVMRRDLGHPESRRRRPYREEDPERSCLGTYSSLPTSPEKCGQHVNTDDSRQAAAGDMPRSRRQLLTARSFDCWFHINLTLGTMEKGGSQKFRAVEWHGLGAHAQRHCPHDLILDPITETGPLTFRIASRLLAAVVIMYINVVVRCYFVLRTLLPRIPSTPGWMASRYVRRISLEDSTPRDLGLDSELSLRSLSDSTRYSELQLICTPDFPVFLSDVTFYLHFGSGDGIPARHRPLSSTDSITNFCHGNGERVQGIEASGHALRHHEQPKI
ncbi:hypothetical protein ACRALDRAFT_207827 [Sodiomyces alcalophilus JCM 7366]|uniref:uncharacterized protein n=1 Tax=Sodiomyces alcalophilus JCM 7366 TaxID=591952 RepID=UPI0039B4B041